MKNTGWLLTGLLLGAAITAAIVLPWSSGKDPGLEAAWQDFMQGLEEAQASLTDPKRFPPEPSDRNLAEGHRYLLGHLGRMIEHEMRVDPRFPEFFRSVDMLRKWTAENPDTLYLLAPVDGVGYYRLSVTAGNTEAWRTSRRDIKGPQAPRMVTFATITDFPGATGNLLEMGTCRNQTLDDLSSFMLEPDAQGRFSILIGPERPADYSGYFLQSRKTLLCDTTQESGDRHAKYIAVREIFSNWADEQSLDMEIVRLDAIGASRPPIDSAFMAQRLSRLGRELPNQVHFWQQIQELALEVNHDVNFDGERAMPVNGTNDPAPPFTAAGVAGAGQLYAGGLFELTDDQALVLKVTAPVEPHYVGLQLSNGWFEGPDQQNYTSSLTGHQLPVSSDGSRYFVIAHRDPGLQGWVDTTGLPKGAHSMRFIFRQALPAQQMPRIETTLVALDELMEHLPADTPTVSAEQRRQEIAVRQSHIKRRWRGY